MNKTFIIVAVIFQLLYANELLNTEQIEQINDSLSNHVNEFNQTLSNNQNHTNLRDMKYNQSKIQLKLRNKLTQLKNNITQSIIYFNQESNTYETIVIYNNSQTIQNQTESEYYFYQNNTIITLEKELDKQGNIVYRNLTYDFTLIVENNRTKLSSLDFETQIFGTLVYQNKALNGTYSKDIKKIYEYNDGMNQKSLNDHIKDYGQFNYNNKYLDGNYDKYESYDSQQSQVNYSAQQAYLHSKIYDNDFHNQTDYLLVADKENNYYQANQDQDFYSHNKTRKSDFYIENNYSYSNSQQSSENQTYDISKDIYLRDGEKSWGYYQFSRNEQQNSDQDQVGYGSQLVNQTDSTSNSYSSITINAGEQDNEKWNWIKYQGQYDNSNNYINNTINQTDYQQLNINSNQQLDSQDNDTQSIQTKQGYFNTSTNITNIINVNDDNSLVNSYNSTLSILNITDSQYGDLNPEIHKTKQQQNISYTTTDEQTDISQLRGSKNKQQINQFNQEENNQQLIQTAIQQVEQTYHPQMNRLILRQTTLQFLKQADQVICKVKLIYQDNNHNDVMEDNSNEQQVYQILLNPQTHEILSMIPSSIKSNEAII